jgi:hypothetical protein
MNKFTSLDEAIDHMFINWDGVYKILCYVNGLYKKRAP